LVKEETISFIQVRTHVTALEVTIVIVLKTNFLSAISLGPGASIAIGDAGTNLVTTTMDIPRIFQIYRSFKSPPGSGYAANVSKYGFLFTSDFDLHPYPLRLTDAQGFSLIDKLLTMGDVTKSNVIRDIIGISSIKTENKYCMLPMFKIIPGFVSETHMLHGNDIIESNGTDVIIGDDIRGFSAVDLTELADVQNSRQVLDNLIVDLSIRLSTLGYDSEFYSKFSNINQTVPFNLTVGCDNITTRKDSHTFVVGDTLTLLGRTFLGASFPFPLSQVPALFERIRDVQQVLVDLHFALYEIHIDLLHRSRQRLSTDFKGTQQPLHRLRLADDTFTAMGNGTVVGDSATLFFQIDSPSPGFKFDTLGSDIKKNLAVLITASTKRRQLALENHVAKDLAPSTPLSNQEMSTLPFADVPYYLSVGNDGIDLFANSVVAVGDFGTFGMVFSESGTSNNLPAFRKFPNSVSALRKIPSVKSFFPALSSLDNLDRFFYQRYNSAMKAQVKPRLHGDTFVGRSSENVMIGDTLSASMVGFARGEQTVRDKTIDFYDTFLNAEYAIFFDPDQVTVPSGSGVPKWVGQYSNDKVFGTVSKVNVDDQVQVRTRIFFDTHAVAKQATTDLFQYTIPHPFEVDLRFNYVCFDPGTSYVPSHTNSIYKASLATELNHTRATAGIRLLGNRRPEVLAQSPQAKMLRHGRGGPEYGLEN
jgi:hypothetical protein